jgi:hypothetical protein
VAKPSRAPFDDGQLPSSEGTIFTVPQRVRTNQEFTSRGVFLFNTNAAEQTIDIFVKRHLTGTTRQIRRIVLKQNESATLLTPDEPIWLQENDTIRASTTTASAVDYSIVGVVSSA